jgi:hypothetical protein
VTIAPDPEALVREEVALSVPEVGALPDVGSPARVESKAATCFRSPYRPFCLLFPQRVSLADKLGMRADRGRRRDNFLFALPGRVHGGSTPTHERQSPDPSSPLS